MAKDTQRKKKKSKKRTHDSDGGENEGAPKLKVPLDTAISSGATAGCSWGSAFAAAARIEPAEGIDEEFLQRTDASSSKMADAGLATISQLAADRKLATAKKRHSKSHKRKRSDIKDVFDATHDVEASQEPESSLEGRMVQHPYSPDEQVMILVDSKHQTVYSALDRTSSGDYLCIGSLSDCGEIHWNKDAFNSSQQQQVDDETKEASKTLAVPVSFPFPTDADDHCESPPEAYHDILPLLEKLCGDNRKDFTIYDPYYCNGAVKRNLKLLGFPSVYNEKEDCYQVWSSRVGYPDFEALITNPPYSNDHIPKLLQHISSSDFGNRPWFLLLPTWVHKKDCYKTATANIQPFYLVPKKRYIYLPPTQFREKKASDVHKKSSPFVSMWYIWGGTPKKNEELIQSFRENDTCDLARSKSALRDLRRKGKKKQKR